MGGPMPHRSKPLNSSRPAPHCLIGAGALLLGLASIGLGGAARAASPLLESVKQNPALAQSICAQLRQFNSQGLSATSPQAVSSIAQQRGLTRVDAEVLTTYVIGLHCPDVR